MLLDTLSMRTHADPHFRSDVFAGFAMRPQRAIPARWLYDRRGSELFEQITGLPEYCLTRTEVTLLGQHSSEIADCVGPGRAVVEFGSGSSSKTRILLSRLDAAVYVPIDISGDFLRQSAAAIANSFPHLPVLPLEADFTMPLACPDEVDGVPKLGFFPGSTIGNLDAVAAVNLLRSMRESLGAGAMLLIGFDRPKDQATVIKAYNDSRGVTAAFNLNLLHRINRELLGTIPISAFRHLARWNAWDARIEMHLEATCNVSFLIDGRRFNMAAGDTLHTENSHKYCLNSASLLLRASGWTPLRNWTDAKKGFALFLAEAEPATMLQV